MNMGGAEKALYGFRDVLIHLGYADHKLFSDPIRVWNYITTYAPDSINWEYGLDDENDLQMTQEEREAEDYLLNVGTEIRLFQTLEKLFGVQKPAKR